MTGWTDERRTLWEVVKEMAASGLVTGSSGNASMLLSQDRPLVLVTPTHVPYRWLKAEELVVMDLEGEPVEGDLVPSFESALHLAIYRQRGDVGAIVHSHPVFASAAAVAGLEIPPILDEMVVSVGGGVRVAEYGFPSTEELAQHALAALEDRWAVLLRNHGLVAVGRTPWEALDNSHLVERIAQVFLYASLLGKASPLPERVVQAEKELFLMGLVQRGGGSS